jgi:DNA-binding LacI/PurR family transcriptional regulator
VAPKYAGFQRALDTAAITTDPRLVASLPNFTREASYQGTLRLLDQPRPPTAIVAANDALALGAMHAIASLGLQIPKDIALVGNDDIEMAAIVRPALTTVALPTREAGIQATKMLQQLIAGQPLEPSRLVLDTHLVTRQTCGCPNQPTLPSPAATPTTRHESQYRTE